MKSPEVTARKHLCGDAPIQLLHDEFQQLSLPIRPPDAISLTDALSSTSALLAGAGHGWARAVNLGKAEGRAFEL